MSEQEILVVAPHDWDEAHLGERDRYRLSFRFVDEYPPDGFSGWQAEAGVGGELIDVAAHCAGLQAGFTHHALNRFFSKAVLRLRPKAVVVVGLFGCTVDLLRVATLLEVPAVLVLDRAPEDALFPDDYSRKWFEAAIAQCHRLFTDWSPAKSSETPPAFENIAVSPMAGLCSVVGELMQQSRPEYQFDYSLYEFCQRDHPLLVNMQQADTRHFIDCSSVLDLACGVGIFLDCLRQQDLAAVGVERDHRLVQYAQGMGLNVSQADAFDHLETTGTRYDGIYCSHFIEHLPVAAVQQLLELAAQRLTADGVLVLVFPDPESIRSQLLGFWRDPEHVRFYHPDLVTSMASSVGLELDWSSYEEQPHVAVPFAPEPPHVSDLAAFPPLPPEGHTASLFEKIAGKFGLVSQSRLERLERRVARWSAQLEGSSGQYAEAARQLEKRTQALWQVNQTWNWNDNATIRLRKRPNSV